MRTDSAYDWKEVGEEVKFGSLGARVAAADSYVRAPAWPVGCSRRAGHGGCAVALDKCGRRGPIPDGYFAWTWIDVPTRPHERNVNAMVSGTVWGM
jgi:hypothetical protein